MLKKLKEDIITGFNILNDNKIFITPLNNIVDGNNNKSVFGSGETLKYYWDCVRTNRRTEINKVLDAVNNNIFGFAIRTGKYNNILVVDVDIKTTSNPDFIDKLHLMNTLTFKTPSGGFHFIFKYTDLLNIRTGIFRNIDIITNNKPIFAGVREDGAYIIYNNNKIRNIDDDLILELNEYQPPQKNKDLKDEDNTNNNKNKPSYIDKYKYDISDSDLLFILSHLPEKYLNEYSPWLCLTYIFKRHNLLNIWDEWSKKSNKYNKKKNIQIWDGLNIEKDEKNLNYIIFLVNHYIKHKYEDIDDVKEYKIFKNINKVYGEYTPLSEENIKCSIPITTQYIDPNIYNVDNDIIIQSGTNTGKSYSIRQYLSKLQQTNPEKKILSLSHLITLCEASISSFNIENIELLKYNTKNIFDFDNKNIAFVINSIDKLNISFDIKNYIIILDEIHALLKVLLTADTLNNKRKYILNIFTTLLKNCHQIIAVDGCICDNVLNYIKKLNRPKKYKFYINDYKSYNNKPAYFINDYENMISLIINDIKNNVDFMACCNTRKEAEYLKRTLNEYFKDANQLKIYTSREGDILGNVNNEWNLKSIIFSPSIVEGVDDNNPKNIYCFVKGNTTLNPEQVSQQIARNRNPINTYINICDTPNDRPRFNNIEDLKTYYKTSENAFIGCYADLVDTVSSIADGLNIIDNDYSNMFYVIDYNNLLMMSSFQYYLKNILLKKGYIISNDLYHNHIKDEKEYKEKKKEKKEQQKKADNDDFNNYVEYNKGSEKFKQTIEGKCEILNIDCYKYNKTLTEKQKKTLYNFEKYLLIEDHFNKHLYFKLLIKNDDYLNDDIKRHSKNDYLYKIISHKINDVKTYKTLIKKYFSNIDIYKFEYNEKDIIKTDINITDDEYNNIRKCNERSGKQKPINNIELLKMLHFLAKKIFGDGSIDIKRETTRENKKITNHNNVCIKDAYYKENISLLGEILGDKKNQEEYNNKLFKIDKTFINEFI
jgi:hypothetical protein